MKKLASVKWLPIALVILFALFPYISESRFLLSMLIQVFILAVYAMSYDLLLGYTGIVSFGHAMFFGVGAYSVGIMLTKTKNPDLLLIAVLAAIGISAVVSVIVGILSLRVKDVYFSMITLAFAELFYIISEKWSSLTGGNDGISSIRVPDIFRDRIALYYIALAFLVLMFLFLRRVVDSPLGRTLEAIRENEHRVESLGIPVLRYKLVSILLSGIVATLAGAMWAIFQRYVNTAVLSLDRTVDALLMTIIGGTGTLVGAVLGSGVITFAHEWLSSLADVHPIFERWLLFFGILYIVIVMFFPKGIVGSIRDRWQTQKGDPRTDKAGEPGRTAL